MAIPSDLTSSLAPASPVEVDGELSELVDFYRLDAARRLAPARRSEMGQYFTPPPVAALMASMVGPQVGDVHFLDAGAGVGSLSVAFVENICRRKARPKSIRVTAYEADPLLVDYLMGTLKSCRLYCEREGISFDAQVIVEDFIKAGVDLLVDGFFSRRGRQEIDCSVVNPPYRKINSDSETRRNLRRIGVETSNLYTAFLSLLGRLLKPSGELVAITPRSFCNGSYFKPFRADFLQSMRIRRIHVFDTRDTTFSGDEVLQENVILHAVKAPRKGGKVVISSSDGPNDESVTMRSVAYQDIVHPNDSEGFIRLPVDGIEDQVTKRILALPASLDDLELTVSTGRVVDFRASKYLRKQPDNETVPLIYPAHFEGGYVKWPKDGHRKPNAIVRSSETEELLVPSGHYVLLKRFSAKEEKRRIVAAIYSPSRVNGEVVGFENHLNYFHQRGKGISSVLARGLAAFLNSTLVDAFFRQFSGHTQVNATDLRTLKYPSKKQLEQLGLKSGNEFLNQEALDRLVDEELDPMPESGPGKNPVDAKKKIADALDVLKSLGMPRAQQNERSALSLLSLLDLKPGMSWEEAGKPLRGITPMMEFFKEFYGKEYAPNTRETVRRQTVHQFVQAGLALPNTDDPKRPPNSPDTVYQIEPSALELLRSFGSVEWDERLHVYQSSVQTLVSKYAKERKMTMIPVRLSRGKILELSPGGQNELISLLLNEFCSRFTPEGMVLYVGDAGKKLLHFDREGLEALGVKIEEHGKMPDLVVYHHKREWLVLVEAVTSHGPVSPKRHAELRELFKESSAGLVFVTAFLTRKAMLKHLSEIAWETEVWVAEAPSHMIHFNGERFLGPYPDPHEQ